MTTTINPKTFEQLSQAIHEFTKGKFGSAAPLVNFEEVFTDFYGER